MKVRELIKELKKMPPGLEVYSRDHDNSEWEMSGYPRRITLFDKDDISLPSHVENDVHEKERYDSLPKRLVVIEC